MRPPENNPSRKSHGLYRDPRAKLVINATKQRVKKPLKKAKKQQKNRVKKP